MRPSISLPTGIMIGLPVSVTSMPRTRPSVESIAMARTVDSPRCCATSSTRLFVSSRDARVGHVQRVEDLRQLARRELDVDDRTDDLGDLAGGSAGNGGGRGAGG